MKGVEDLGVVVKGEGGWEAGVRVEEDSGEEDLKVGDINDIDIDMTR